MVIDTPAPTWVIDAEGYYHLHPEVACRWGVLHAIDSEFVLVLDCETGGAAHPNDRLLAWREATGVRVGLSSDWQRHGAMFGGEWVRAASADVFVVGAIDPASITSRESLRATPPEGACYVLGGGGE